MAEKTGASKPYYRRAFDLLMSAAKGVIPEDELKKIMLSARGHTGGVTSPKEKDGEPAGAGSAEPVAASKAAGFGAIQEAVNEAWAAHVNVSSDECQCDMCAGMRAQMGMYGGENIQQVPDFDDRIVEIYADHFVAYHDGDLVSVDYTVNADGTVTLTSDEVPVEITYSPIGKAEWSAAKINDLPDSSFMHIAPGGKKDADGKTVPRSLRFFPVRDADGNIDMPHLRNARARIPQSDLPQSVKDQMMAKAGKMMDEMTSSTSKSAADPTGPRERGELSERIPIMKWDEEKHLIYGIVVEPMTIDAHGDWVTEQDIAKACHAFMRKSQAIYLEHGKPSSAVSIVENYLAPADMSWMLPSGETKMVSKGAWIMVTHVDVGQEHGQRVWDGVKKGEFNGYSYRGEAYRTPRELVA